jgi:hypothetical protein
MSWLWYLAIVWVAVAVVAAVLLARVIRRADTEQQIDAGMRDLASELQSSQDVDLGVRGPTTFPAPPPHPRDDGGRPRGTAFRSPSARSFPMTDGPGARWPQRELV